MVEVHFLQSSQVLGQLKENLRGSRSLKIAVAFLKKSGYAEIRRGLIGLLNRGRPAEFVIGISNYGITDWEVLDDLYELKGKYANLGVKYYNNEGFHAKLFLFGLPRNKTSIILGSSNLTGGGVRTNVEANLLLEGTGSEGVIADIVEFFENVFRTAEKLKSEVIEDYRATCERSRHRKRQSGRKSHIKKTPLVSMREEGVEVPFPLASPSTLRDKSFWKVAPGEDGWQWPLWEREIEINSKGVRRGIIAIGWGYNMTKLPFDDPVALKGAIERKLKQARSTSRPGYVTSQVQRFGREIRRGDIIVAYSRSLVHAIAQVEDERPYHVRTKDWRKEPFENRRTVRWLTLRKWRPQKRFMNILARPNDTVHRITDISTIERIEKELARPTFD